MAFLDKNSSESGGNPCNDLNMFTTINKIEVEIHNLHQRMDKWDSKMDKFEERIAEKLDKISSILSGNDVKVSVLEVRVKTLEDELSKQNAKTDWIMAKIIGISTGVGGLGFVVIKFFS